MNCFPYGLTYLQPDDKMGHHRWMVLSSNPPEYLHGAFL